MRAKRQSGWIQSTKWISAFGISAWFVVLSAHGEDVPPAFERGDGESAAATEHDLYDPFDPFDPITDAPKLIRVQVEHIDLPHKELTRLLMQDKSTTADATALRMAVQKLADEDIAKVIDTQIVVGKKIIFLENNSCVRRTFVQFMGRDRRGVSRKHRGLANG